MGLINGVIIAILILFEPPADSTRYRSSIRWGSALLSGLLALAAFPIVLHTVNVGSIAPEVFGIDTLFLSIALISGAVGFWASDRILRWYVTEVG
jgi:hypothetical protein